LYYLYYLLISLLPTVLYLNDPHLTHFKQFTADKSTIYFIA